MNPYAYQRSKTRTSASSKVAGPTFSSLAKDFLSALAGAKISAVTALAFILFAAVSVGAMTMISYAEIAGADSFAQSTAIAKGRVLGVDAYTSQLVTSEANSSIKIYVTPVSYSQASGMWNYKVSWARAKNVVGSIYINDQAISASAPQNGEGTFQVAPSSKNKVEFYSLANKKGTLLVRRYFTSKDASVQVACTQDAYQCADGSWVGRTAPACNFICPTTTPSYGYQTANVGPVNKGEWREGWIERFSASNFASEPADITVEGWAYDSGKALDIKIALKDSVTGKEYSAKSVSQWPMRNDIAAYLAPKIVSGKTFNGGMFKLVFSTLPAGKYYLANARYNGFLFNVHNQAYQPMWITAQPSYGYNGGLNLYSRETNAEVSIKAGTAGADLFFFEVSNSAGKGPYSLNSITFAPYTADALSSIGNYWVTDEYGNIIGYKDSVIAPSVQYGYNIIFPAQLVIGVNQVRYLKFKADILGGAPNKTIQFQALGIGYTYPNNAGYSYPGQINGLNNAIGKKITIVTSTDNQNIPRPGQLVNKEGTVYLVGNGVLHGIPSLAVFNSWGWVFTNVVTINSAESALPQGSPVPMKDPSCNKVLDQIAGKCGTGSRPIDISISLNSAVSSPIKVTPGQINQKIASFVISSGTSGEVNVSYIGFSAATGMENFKNLKMMVGSTQIGAIVPNLVAGQSYYFSPSAPGLKIPANGQIVVDAFADAGTVINVNNSVLISLYRIGGTLSSGASIPDNLGLMGQLVAVNGTTNTSFSVSINAAVDHLYVTSGKTNQKVGSFVLMANAPVTINSITMYATRNSIGSSFSNMVLKKGNSQENLAVAQSFISSNSNYTFILNNPLTISAVSAQIVDVYVDVDASAYSLGINGQNLVGLRSVNGYENNSGAALVVPWPVSGQVIYILNTASNQTPSAPTLPLGLSNIQAGNAQKVQVVASDPDQDQLTYVINWGDNSATTTLTGLAGTAVETSHTWSTAGTYMVRILVSDGKGGTSNNSYIATVSGFSNTLSLGAAFVSQSVPAIVSPGSYLDATVVFKNTGSQTWTNSTSNYQFQIGSQNPTGNKTWEGNALTVYKDVAPGETIPFVFHVKAPSVMGVYNFQWQMLQNSSAGAKYFGDLTPNMSIVVK